MNDAVPIDWTDDKIEQLKDRLKDGINYDVIGKEFGVSKSSISGKVSRLKLNEKRKIKEPTPKAPKFRRAKRTSWAVKPLGEHLPPEPIAVQKVSLPEPVSLELSLVELKPHQCKWPSGDGPFTFCGASAFGVYCEHHRKRAYQPLVPRKIREPA